MILYKEKFRSYALILLVSCIRNINATANDLLEIKLDIFKTILSSF